MERYTAFLAVALAFGLCQVTAADGPAASPDARSLELVTPAAAASQNLQTFASQDCVRPTTWRPPADHARRPSPRPPLGLGSQDGRRPDERQSEPH